MSQYDDFEPSDEFSDLASLDFSDDFSEDFSKKMPDLEPAFVMGPAEDGALIDSIDAEDSLFSSARGDLPPERVRFTAPAYLEPEGQEEEFEGFIINLSLTGAAISSPVELNTRQRVWLRFRPGLAEDPLDLLCEVIWRTGVEVDKAPIYGVRFTSLMSEDEHRIQQAVGERTEGKAADWPMPIMGEDSHPVARHSYKYSSVVTGLGGMVAGVALALVLSALPRMGSDAEHNDAPQITQSEVGIPDALAAAPAPAWVQRTPAPEKKAVAKETKKEKEFVLKSVKKEEKAVAKVAVEVEEKLAAAPDTEASDSQENKSAFLATQDIALVHLPGSEGIEISLPLDGTASELNSFWLDNPRRFVLDVKGRRSLLEKKSYELNDSLASRIRVGQYGDKVRFVIEATDSVDKNIGIKKAEGRIILQLQRQTIASL
ncbi:PilZ domain-containing protein [Myxococcota bacterium]|nr:PilZ domain-containing protein [Myxococcota bacterium]